MSKESKESAAPAKTSTRWLWVSARGASLRSRKRTSIRLVGWKAPGR